jgi:hypothetical protein
VTRRRLLSPLLLLVALLTSLGLNLTPASATGEPETRVRATNHVPAVRVGESSSESPGGVGCLRPETGVSVVGSCVATNTEGLTAAEQASDAAGLKPDGTPNRDSPVYVGGYDSQGNVMGTGNGPQGSGIHAEDIIQQHMPGAQITEPYAWRTNKGTGELGWRPFTVCATCQGKYPPSLFPPGTQGAAGGHWSLSDGH